MLHLLVLTKDMQMRDEALFCRVAIVLDVVLARRSQTIPSLSNCSVRKIPASMRTKSTFRVSFVMRL